MKNLTVLGGYTVYGTIDTYENGKAENGVPLGLINKNAVMTKDVKKGELITFDAVELDKETLIYKLRNLQETLIG